MNRKGKRGKTEMMESWRRRRSSRIRNRRKMRIGRRKKDKGGARTRDGRGLVKKIKTKN